MCGYGTNGTDLCAPCGNFVSQTSTEAREATLLDDFPTLYMISKVKSHSYKGCSVFYVLSKSEGSFSIEAI